MYTMQSAPLAPDYVQTVHTYEGTQTASKRRVQPKAYLNMALKV